MSWLKEGIDRVLSLRPIEVVSVDGRTYSTEPLHPMKDPAPPTLTVNTLTALVEYILGEVDVTIPGDISDKDAAIDHLGNFIHVVDPVTVRFHDYLTEDFAQRFTYVEAEHQIPPFQFNRFMDVESFIIALQSKFLPTEHRETILQIVGNLKAETVGHWDDDGVTQRVTVRQGVANLVETKPPRIVTLRPYRTFLEVEQPESQFIFRLQSGEKSPTCGLFEADGGMWSLEAIQRIRDWLESALLARKLVILA